MGGSKGSSGSQKSTSSTSYPADFLNLFQGRFGQGLSLSDVANLLPHEQSLFGGGSAYGATSGVPGAAGSTVVGPGGSANSSGRVPYSQISALIQQQYSNDPVRASRTSKAILDQMQARGIDPNVGVTPDELSGFVGSGPNQTNYVQGFLPSQAQGQVAQPPQVGQTGTGANLAGLDVNNRIQQLFQPQQNQATPFNFSSVPTINAPTAQAQEMNVAPGGFDAYQNALFGSLYNPAARSINQQGALQDRQLQAQLAQSGLASSGAGIGQVQQQQRQRSEQLLSTAQQAAQQATTQRFGAEFTQSQFNAGQRQQTNLANAGFDMDAQKTNASNILAGDTVKSDNYLKTIGLNQQGANTLRSDFLNLLNIGETDLKRLSDSQRDNLGLLLNNWLQQGALLGNLGQQTKSTGKTKPGGGGGLSITSASSSS